MKINVEFDCTPEEARAFMGLPDVQPMQAALMKDLEARMRANIEAMSPEAMAKTWLPAGIQGAEQMQKMFWAQLQQAFSNVSQATGGMVNFADHKAKAGK